MNHFNRRQTFADAVKRSHAYTKGQDFVQASSVELNTKLEELKVLHDKFTEEHLKIGENTPRDLFSEHDRCFEEQQEIYSSAAIAFRKRIAEIETAEHEHRHNASIFLRNEVAAASTNMPKYPLVFDHRVMENVEPDSSSEASESTQTSAHQNENASLRQRPSVQISFQHNTEATSRQFVTRPPSPPTPRGERAHERTPSPMPVERRRNHSTIHFERTRSRSPIHVERVQSRPPMQPTHSRRRLACYYCQGSHPMSACLIFRGLRIDERLTVVRRMNLCPTCLAPEPNAHRCTGIRCFCGRMHNTLLCFEPRSYWQGHY